MRDLGAITTKKLLKLSFIQDNALVTVRLSSAKLVTLHFCASGMSILLFYLSSQKFKVCQFRIRRPGAETRNCYLSWMPEESRFLKGDRLVLRKRKGGRF